MIAWPDFSFNKKTPENLLFFKRYMTVRFLPVMYLNPFQQFSGVFI